MGEGAKSGPTLNGATISAGGPAPPPVTPPRQRRGSCCGPCCILKHILGLLITLIIVVGIAALVIWLVLRPSKPKFYVDTVQFSNIINSTSSNIVLGMSIRNANKKIGIYYDALRVSAYYSGGGTVGVDALEEFYQGHKNTTTLRPLIISVGNVYLPRSTSMGVEDVELKLRSRVRFRVGKVKTNRFKLKVKCYVSVPLNEASASAFTRKKCDVELDH
ncbi:hypothetical protein SUGI_1191670 [Cryptomeria japonica]|uniref:NDR1/HIN1-like protein 3 n=1 Tax=Cryptomeria japonica TaxID=3369 RepID=UPI002414AAA8|nr:NDR1/HIN1-like protein 3 [Cryptomeria japonica]GLJ55495.1 hypothetical protein SUGI_1191670 [Cryptomeria japonica]